MTSNKDINKGLILVPRLLGSDDESCGLISARATHLLFRGIERNSGSEPVDWVGLFDEVFSAVPSPQSTANAEVIDFLTGEIVSFQRPDPDRAQIVGRSPDDNKNSIRHSSDRAVLNDLSFIDSVANSPVRLAASHKVSTSNVDPTLQNEPLFSLKWSQGASDWQLLCAIRDARHVVVLKAISKLSRQPKSVLWANPKTGLTEKFDISSENEHSFVVKIAVAKAKRRIRALRNALNNSNAVNLVPFVQMDGDGDEQ